MRLLRHFPNQFTLNNCAGSPVDTVAVTQADESLPGAEARNEVPTGTDQAVTVNWGAIPERDRLPDLPSDTGGKEKLLDRVGAPTPYSDQTSRRRRRPADRGRQVRLGIAVAVNVAVANTNAYLERT